MRGKTSKCQELKERSQKGQLFPAGIVRTQNFALQANSGVVTSNGHSSIQKKKHIYPANQYLENGALINLEMGPRALAECIPEEKKLGLLHQVALFLYIHSN